MSLGVRLTSDRGIYGLAASCTFVYRATDAQDVAQPPAKQAPAHPAAGTPVRVDKNIRGCLKTVLASTGHRGRVDARGPRRHGAPGLTRTSGLAVGAPSRVQRARRLRRRVLAVALRGHATARLHRATGSSQHDRQITTRCGPLARRIRRLEADVEPDGGKNHARVPSASSKAERIAIGGTRGD